MGDRPPITPPPAPPRTAAHAFHVLWCDRDPRRGARGKKVLAGRASVEVVRDIELALEAARAILPDLAVCAMESDREPPLPAAFAADPKLASVPIVLLVPDTATADAAAARHSVADVLAEPLSDSELAARIAAQLEIARLRRALAEKESESETWLGLALKAAGLGVWYSPLASSEIHMDANLAAMFGLPRAPVRLTDAEWLARIHPDDRERVLSELAARRRDLKPLEIDFRTVLPDGSTRSLAVLGAVVRRADDAAYRSVGVARDVTERVRDSERQRLLTSELNHRVGNTLASVLSLAHQTAQGARSVTEFLSAFQARVMALGAAHNLLTRGYWKGAALGALVETTLAPERSAAPDRVETAGPACELPPQKALAITMGLHELATNARKYGSLSTPAGSVSVRWSLAGGDGEKRLTLVWRERGGPPVTQPSRQGFGTRLLQRALGVDLGGSVKLDFDPHGLCCTIDFPMGTAKP